MVKLIKMKKILIAFFLTMYLSALNADPLEKTIQEVYKSGSNKILQYIEESFPGLGDTEVSFQAKHDGKPHGSIMVVRPITIENDRLTFYQAQFNNSFVLGKERQSINAGIGKRILSDDKSYFTGLNGFFDVDQEGNKRISLGAEVKSSTFELNANYYLGLLDDDKENAGATERVLDGHDINLAGQVPYTPWAKLVYTNYKWKKEKNSDDSQGKIYRGEVFVSDKVTLEGGFDDNNASDNMNFIKLTYVYPPKERPTMADGLSDQAFENSDVSKDMLTKVRRSNVITLEVETSGVVIARGSN